MEVLNGQVCSFFTVKRYNMILSFSILIRNKCRRVVSSKPYQSWFLSRHKRLVANLRRGRHLARNVIFLWKRGILKWAADAFTRRGFANSPRRTGKEGVAGEREGGGGTHGIGCSRLYRCKSLFAGIYVRAERVPATRRRNTIMR